MDTDRPHDVDSPLIEDFLDCDQLGTDSDGGSTSTGPVSTPPRRRFTRLHIRIDMASAQYLAPLARHLHPEHSQFDGLPVCSGGPPAVAYTSSDLDLLSATSHVSSFNNPATVDETLLTPASSTGSPPLQQKPASKHVRNYHSRVPAPGSQPPTPPSASGMYYGGYDVSSGSQSPSPMAVNPSAADGHFEMGSYMAHSPPASQHPSSPKSEIGPPVDPYLGHFSVSGGHEGELTHHTLHHQQQYANPFAVGVTAPGAYLGQEQHHMHHRMLSDGHAPVLSHPHPSHFRPHPGPQVGAIEDLRGDPAMFLGGYPSRATLSPGRRPQPRKKAPSTRKPSRTPKPALPAGAADGQAGGAKHQEDDDDELTLRDDAPEDEKYLFQLRKEFLSEKGKGMWEEMKTRYSAKHQGNWEKAALQMKVSRAVAKYGVWPEKELERLRAAFQYVEEKRYQLILAHMKESGGCRVWDWKTQHLEAMLVKLGLEERTPDERTGSRRRRHNKVARRQTSPQNGARAPTANVMGDWSSGLGLHQHPHPHPHPHAAFPSHRGPPPQAFESMLPDDVSAAAAAAAPTFTPEQENEFIDQIYQRAPKTERSLSPDDHRMDLTYSNSNGGDDRRPSAPTLGAHGLQLHHHHHHHHQQQQQQQQHSEHMARQACDQLFQQQQQQQQQQPKREYAVAQ
ncbi:hypothetical protein BT67DRAFT_185627 [Trichocladium antarcticum]|uniref:Uncharacterized protein n=1 Tax=Trichocladium antarcticum TaxID=1450529 RepID=A0AAN6UPS7_9PEZI|nr:hypothetical protein BT67DRAFT_185627 [Trichocladium antarcticum]